MKKESRLQKIINRVLGPVLSFLYSPEELSVQKKKSGAVPRSPKRTIHVKAKSPKSSSRAKGKRHSDTKIFNHPRKDIHSPQ